MSSMTCVPVYVYTCPHGSNLLVGATEWASKGNLLQRCCSMLRAASLKAPQYARVKVPLVDCWTVAGLFYLSGGLQQAKTICQKGSHQSLQMTCAHTLLRTKVDCSQWGSAGTHKQAYTCTKRKVLFGHMCPSVIYERAPGLMPQRGPLHAAWLWVLCAIPPLGTGL